MFGNPGPFSYSPRGFSPDDLPQQRRGFHPEDLKGSPLQRNNMSRPSGRSIYMQRKEYSETLNQPSDNFHFRVEHLFTCDLDGQDVQTINDCLTKLKRLDAKGRLWPQEMILEVQGGYLLLCDIETKSELELVQLSCIQQIKAVLDSCAYNSLLTITVQERNKRIPQVFMFQCEDTGADLIKADLDKVIERGGGATELIPNQMATRSNLENIIGLQASGSFRQPGPRAVLREPAPPPPEYSAPQWNVREPENLPPPQVYAPPPEPHERQIRPEEAPAPHLTETDRNTEILNHVLDDLEIFMSHVSAAADASLAQEEKSKKKNKFKKKQGTKNAPAINLPSWEEYVSCLQKVKYAFNLLGQLDGSLTNPSAEDFVHILFSTLGMLVPQYPLDLPPTVLSPLLTDPAIHLLSQVVYPEEDALWRSLGDPWNIPRSRWPDDVPPYIPVFYDGWQPPPPSQNRPMSRSSSQRLPPEHPQGRMNNSMKEPPGDSSWVTPPQAIEPLYMRAIYDFTARNNRELSLTKGDMVQVIQKNKQWWLVRNNRDEEGHVPQNVLEPIRGSSAADGPQRESRGPPALGMNSTAAEVKAWLEYKGFSKITVSSLGVLNGKLLLGMSKDDIRTVCPEEGGKVFFQLQAVKSAIALSSEPSGLYNSHY